MAALTVTPVARADDQDDARRLFEDGRALMKAAKYVEACPKFESANALLKSAGILLNLGDCYENTGKLARAWARFGEAAEVASQTSRAADALEAKRRQQLLDARVARIVVHVARELPGMAVKCDGLVLAPTAWGSAVPVDPGAHEIQVEAPDHEPWVKAVPLARAGETIAIDVPELRSSLPAATPATEAKPPLEPRDDNTEKKGSFQRVMGLSLGGLGVVGMGVGVGLGLGAKAKFDEAEQKVGQARHDESVSAAGRGDVATVVFVAGAAAAAAGVVVWLTAPSAPVAVGTTGEAIFMTGRF
jgi:tetratricopeptide (TPR) repeat protein